MKTQMIIEYEGAAEYSPDYIKAGSTINKGLLDTEYVMYDQGLKVKPQKGAEVLATILNPYFNRDYTHFCSHFQTPPEKEGENPAIVKNGNVIYFSHPIFSMYYKHGTRAYKQLVLNSINLLLAEKLIVTDAPTTAHIYLNHQPGFKRYVAHILHYIPERRSEAIDIIEDVIPLYSIKLEVKLPVKPVKVYLAPSGKALDYKYEDGYVKVTVPEVRGHEMIVFEQ